jgi:hypothetical protein
VQICVRLREQGHRVVLVSSGAIGVGMKRMGLTERGKGLKRKQVGLEHLSLRLEEPALRCVASTDTCPCTI